MRTVTQSEGVCQNNPLPRCRSGHIAAPSWPCLPPCPVTCLPSCIYCLPSMTVIYCLPAFPSLCAYSCHLVWSMYCRSSGLPPYQSTCLISCLPVSIVLLIFPCLPFSFFSSLTPPSSIPSLHVSLPACLTPSCSPFSYIYSCHFALLPSSLVLIPLLPLLPLLTCQHACFPPPFPPSLPANPFQTQILFSYGINFQTFVCEEVLLHHHYGCCRCFCFVDVFLCWC